MPTEPHLQPSMPPGPVGGADPKLAAAVILDACPSPPRLGIVLGSGFSDATKSLTQPIPFDYSSLPGFRAPGVPGHPGRLLIGELAGVPTVMMQGRLHAYEGYDLGTVTFPIRVLAALGVRHLLLTNAAGGIRDSFQAGDLVVISDHLNALGAHPLRGVPPPSGFIDLSEVYAPRLRSYLTAALRDCDLSAHEGVYAAVAGPAFETPAEIRALRTMGADLVGMSTVAEAIVARHCGLETAALSCVTNRAAGLGGRITHDEVIEVGRRVAPIAQRVLQKFAHQIAAEIRR